MTPNRTGINPWLVGTVLSWGFNFVAIKLVYQEMTPSAVALSRFLAMFAVLLLLCKVTGRSLKYPGGKLALEFLALGALNMGVYMVFFLEGMRKVGAGEGSILISTAPIFTGIFAALFRMERFHWSRLLGGVIAVLGVSLVVGPSLQGHSEPQGVAMLVTASALWGLCAVFTRRLSAHAEPLTLLTQSLPGSLIVLIPYGLRDVMATPWLDLSSQTWLCLTHISLLAGALGFFGFNHGVGQVGPNKAMQYQFFVPPTAMLSAFLVFGIVPVPIQFLGVAFVIAGVGVSAKGANWLRKSSDNDDA